MPAQLSRQLKEAISMVSQLKAFSPKTWARLSAVNHGTNVALPCMAKHCPALPVWLDRVEGIVPDVGYHVHWFGLWQELVNGEAELMNGKAGSQS
eukprot:1160513-Pelagomonas_calceolata.AAC.5